MPTPPAHLADNRVLITGGAGVREIFTDQARRDADITVNGDGTQTRDFVHVDDVVQTNLRAATTDVGGRSYNVGTGAAVTVRRLATRPRRRRRTVARASANASTT